MGDEPQPGMAKDIVEAMLDWLGSLFVIAGYMVAGGAIGLGLALIAALIHK